MELDQRRLLRSLVDNDAIWTDMIGNAQATLARLGLPFERDALAALIRAERG